MANTYIQFTGRLKATSQEGILAEAQQVAISSTDNTDIKTYVDNKVGAKADSTTLANEYRKIADSYNKTEVDQKISTAVSSVYRFKGSKTATELAQLTSAQVGDVYNITTQLTISEGGTNKVYPAGTNVVCVASFSSAQPISSGNWDALAGFIDLSPYATTTALNTVKGTADSALAKANANATTLTNKVDKVSGKGLSTEDFTTAYKAKLEGIAAGAEVNTLTDVTVNGTSVKNGKTAVVVVPKTYYQTTTPDKPADSAGVNWTSTNMMFVDKATADNAGVMTASDKKNLDAVYDEVYNEDYGIKQEVESNSDSITDINKKLNGVASGAQVNVLEGVQLNGTDLAITNKKVNIPLAGQGVNGLMFGTDKVKLDQIDLAGDSNFTISGYSCNVDVQIGTSLIFKKETGQLSIDWEGSNNTKLGNQVDIGENVTIGSNLYIDNGVKIGYDSNIGHESKIGDNVNIGSDVKIGNNVNLKIDSDVFYLGAGTSTTSLMKKVVTSGDLDTINNNMNNLIGSVNDYGNRISNLTTRIGALENLLKLA